MIIKGVFHISETLRLKRQHKCSLMPYTEHSGHIHREHVKRIGKKNRIKSLYSVFVH